MFWYMEEGSSPKIADQLLGSDGASPFTNTSTTSEKLWTPQAHAGDEGGESPLGAVDVKHPSPITRLMQRTGYSILQWNGQRCYGDWEPLNLFFRHVISTACQLRTLDNTRTCIQSARSGLLYSSQAVLPAGESFAGCVAGC